MPHSLFRLLAVTGAMLLSAPIALAAEANDPWPGLVQDIFNNRPMNDGSDVMFAGPLPPPAPRELALFPVAGETLPISFVTRGAAVTVTFFTRISPLLRRSASGPKVG